jgi:hypothetical protein
MMRTIVSALIAVALVGAGCVSTASAAGGVGGFGGGGGYPASFGGNYAEAGGDCRLVAQSRHDTPRLANTTRSGLQLIDDKVERTGSRLNGKKPS